MSGENCVNVLEYNRAIQRANKAYTAKNYAGAKADYQKALSLKANDKL